MTDHDDTYDLAMPDDEPVAPDTPKPRAKPKGDVYDLQDPDETPSSESAATGASKWAVTPDEPASPPDPAEKPQTPPADNEPKVVDPEVQRMRREEQRIRASEQLAIEHAAKQRRKRILIVIGIVVAIVLWVVLKWVW